MMNPCRSRLLLGIFALSTLSLLACSSSDSPSGAGGSSGGEVTSSGGVSAGGTTTRPPASGGALPSAGTPASGGQAQAGSVAQGGSDTGGVATSAAGRTAPGGTLAGSSGTGGAAGGGEAGGSPAAGSETGGSPAAGSVAGGSKIGGSVAGGSIAGGSLAGGSLAAGTTAGGSVAGGSRAGGSVAGGSKAGGSLAGGTTTGGVTTGGIATGGKTSTGSVGGAASGGAVVTPATGTYPVSSGKPTIYLASDSTVSYYPPTTAGNQEGLGQELQNFFTSDVVVVDDAIGGRSSKSFIDEKHLDAILALIKPGDYLFAEWGINDRYTSDTTRYTNPATTYRTYLQQYIDGARAKNAIPVIITPTPRLDYQNGVFNNDYVAYCAADAAVAASSNTPLIDLQTMALAYYTKIGITAVQTTIVLVSGGQPNVLHFQAHGAYEMARLVALGVQALNLPISQYVIQAKLDGG
jgi:lysophospholipase L1-like esterase